jgi:hypothetical protein
MTPSWLGAEPRVRRLLILRAHRWIVERVLVPLSRGEEPTVDDLAPAGHLAWALVRTVPRGELDRWKSWIHLALRDMGRALGWPPARRSQAWVRWLFLIPYSMPVSPRGPSGLESPGACVTRRPATPPGASR